MLRISGSPNAFHAARLAPWLLACLLLLTAVAACGSAPVDPPDEEPGPLDSTAQRLLGQWRWVRSAGGIAGQVRTPVTEGFTRTVRFVEPDRVEVRRDAWLEVQTRFGLRPARDQVSIPPVRSASSTWIPSRSASRSSTWSFPSLTACASSTPAVTGSRAPSSARTSKKRGVSRRRSALLCTLWPAGYRRYGRRALLSARAGGRFWPQGFPQEFLT